MLCSSLLVFLVTILFVPASCIREEQMVGEEQVVGEEQMVKIGFDPTFVFVTEGVDGFACLTLVRGGEFSRQIRVTVTPIPGTAEARADFIGTPITVIFGCNATEVTVRIPIVNDFVPEQVEIFTAKLSTCDQNVELDEDHACIIIEDNDRIKIWPLICGNCICEERIYPNTTDSADLN